MYKVMKFLGFDNSSDVHSDFNFKIMYMVADTNGESFVSASEGIICTSLDKQDEILAVETSWELMYELGKNIFTEDRSVNDAMTSIFALYFSSLNGSHKITEKNLYEDYIYPKVGLDDYSMNILNNNNSDGYKLIYTVPLWQLHLYDSEFYAKFEQEYRENHFEVNSKEDMLDYWVKAASDALQLDLTEFFARHGIYASDEIKSYVSKYKKPSIRIEFLNDSVTGYEGYGFTGSLTVGASINYDDELAILSLSVDEANEEHLLGYEIRRDGNYIGFTTRSTFRDTNVDLDTEITYTVTAYDKRLNAVDSIELKKLSSAMQDDLLELLNELQELIEEAEILNLNNYSYSSIIVLEKSLDKAKDLLSSTDRDSIISITEQLRTAINSLEEIDLDEIVEIPDSYLKKSIQKELNKTGAIIIRDMRSLKTLNLSGVVDLTGIEHAINLEVLNMNHNEVKDLRPLASLSKLKTLNANQQFIAAGSLYIDENKVIFDTSAYNIDGKNVVTSIRLVDKNAQLIQEYTANVNNDMFIIDTRSLLEGLYSIHINFEAENFSGIIFYLFDKVESGNQGIITPDVDKVKDTVNSLEVDLQEIVEIPDPYLKRAIQIELNIAEEITVGDMHNLTTLNLSGVADLTGLEYAINLETLNMEYDEVKDLRPLANLTKLTTINASEQFISAGSLYISV